MYGVCVGVCGCVWVCVGVCGWMVYALQSVSSVAASLLLHAGCAASHGYTGTRASEGMGARAHGHTGAGAHGHTRKDTH